MGCKGSRVRIPPPRPMYRRGSAGREAADPRSFLDDEWRHAPQYMGLAGQAKRQTMPAMRQTARAFNWDTEPADNGPSEFVDTRRLEAASGHKPPKSDRRARRARRAPWKLLASVAVIVGASGAAVLALSHWL